MARGSAAADTAAKSAQGLSNTLQGNSQALYGALTPRLTAQVDHPEGFAPEDLAAMNTASQQSAGGAMASAVGQGALKAARTHNIGASDAAIQESARNTGQKISDAALKTQTANAALKQQQHEQGLSGLEGLYGENLGSSIGALGQVAGNVNASTNAANSSWNWARYLLDPAMSAASNAYAAG